MEKTTQVDVDVLGARLAELEGAGVKEGNEIVASAKSGELTVYTAQPVAVRRDIQRVRSQIKLYAQEAGMRYVYSIPFRNKATGRTTQAEGPTIKCANDIARLYGNCMVETRVITEKSHWIIYARFIDLETGFSMVRPFQQRFSQNVGDKMDSDRALDAVFQIGVSKAIRNVVVNALQNLSDFAVEEARRSVINRVANNPEGAKNEIGRRLASMEVDQDRVATAYGRQIAEMLNHDLARLWAEIQAVEEGMANANEVWPEKAVVMQQKNLQPQGAPAPQAPAPQAPAPQAPAPKAPAPQAPAPEPESAPAPAQRQTKSTEWPKRTPEGDWVDSMGAIWNPEDYAGDPKRINASQDSLTPTVKRDGSFQARRGSKSKTPDMPPANDPDGQEPVVSQEHEANNDGDQGAGFSDEDFWGDDKDDTNAPPQEEGDDSGMVLE